jgi:hypothetical protein
MTEAAHPITNELTPLSAAYATLQEQGVEPGRNGYDIETLAAAVYDKKWSYGIDLETGSYVAIIKTEVEGNSHQRATRVRHGLITAYGDTPADALAVALAQALERTAAV